QLPQAFQVLPVMVYKVYADGRPDELVRGVDIVGTPLAALTRILTTGDQPRVFNGVCGAESGQVPVAAVALRCSSRKWKCKSAGTSTNARRYCRRPVSKTRLLLRL